MIVHEVSIKADKMCCFYISLLLAMFLHFIASCHMFDIMRNLDELCHAMFDVMKNNDKICCLSISSLLALFDTLRNYDFFFFLAYFDVSCNV